MLDSQPMASRKERHHSSLGNAPYLLRGLRGGWS
jgi:hypothetical protein